MRIRRLLLWLHRWAGVLAGLFVLILAVTGGALVFESTIQRWTRPDLYPKSATPKADRSPIGVAVENLQKARPDSRVQGMRLPRHEKDALVLFTQQVAIHFDPADGTLLGTRPRKGGWEQTMVKLHVNLMQGKVGANIVTVATCITLGLAFTGLWLWWPLRIFRIRKRANSLRFHLDLHSVAGLYSSLFLIVVCVTGLTLRYLHGEHPQPPPGPGPPFESPLIGLDEAVTVAEKSLPGSRAVALEMPPPGRAVLRVQLAFPEDGSPAGRSVVFVNRIDGEALGVHSSRIGTWTEQYQMAQLSIHTGAIGGTATRWLALLVCLALVLQILSGYALWWKRK